MPLLYVFAAAILWSTGGLFIKWTEISGLAVNFYRSFFAGLTVAILTRREGFGLNSVTLIATFLYTVVVILFVLATKQTTAANAIFLQYTAPVYVLIFEPLMYKERFRSRDLITVLVCLGGMVLFFVGQLRAQDVTGNLMALASGFFFAFYFLMLRHPRAREVNRASSVIYGNLVVFIVTAPWGIAAFPSLGPNDVFAVAYLGVVQLGISYALFTTGMARGVRSLDAGIICYIEPALNPVWVYLFLRERPSRWPLIGGAIIILTVIIHTLLDRKSSRINAD
jgi:drug/metabolite transporter, DME family